jgi:D-arabinose 1-dehydrogenase-like Zn-dependent alcohol dehydrogenase
LEQKKLSIILKNNLKKQTAIINLVCRRLFKTKYRFKTYALKDATKALKDMMRRKTKGKIIIDMKL